MANTFIARSDQMKFINVNTGDSTYTARAYYLMTLPNFDKDENDNQLNTRTIEPPTAPTNKGEVLDQPAGTPAFGDWLKKWYWNLPSGLAADDNTLVYSCVATWNKKIDNTINNWETTPVELFSAYIAGSTTPDESYAQFLLLTDYDTNDGFGYSNNKLYIKASFIKTTELLIQDTDKNTLFAAGGNGDYRNAVKIGGFTVSKNSLCAEEKDKKTSKVVSKVYVGTDKISLGVDDKFSVDAKGALHSTSGDIGGWSINKDNLSCDFKDKNNITYNFTLGEKVDGDGGGADAPFLRLQSMDSNSTLTQLFTVQRDGLVKAAKIHISGEGEIAGWKLNQSTLTSGTDTDGALFSSMLSNDNGPQPVLQIKSNGDTPFKLLGNGKLIATSAEIKGEITADLITASNGNIAGFTLDNNRLSSGLRVESEGGLSTQSKLFLSSYPSTGWTYNDFDYKTVIEVQYGRGGSSESPVLDPVFWVRPNGHGHIAGWDFFGSYSQNYASTKHPKEKERLGFLGTQYNGAEEQWYCFQREGIHYTYLDQSTKTWKSDGWLGWQEVLAALLKAKELP